jgi:Uma2 family endonuclease
VDVVALEQRVHRLSTAEYERMVNAGALESMEVELLDGLLVDVSPQGEWHARVVQRFMRMFASRLELLRIQMPLAVVDGWTPEPDIAVAEPSTDPDRHPSTAHLVVEVAVTSQAEDRRKALAYAQARIPRYWLVDLPGGFVLEHTQPTQRGYDQTTRLAGTDTLDPRMPGVASSSVDALIAH